VTKARHPSARDARTGGIPRSWLRHRASQFVENAGLSSMEAEIRAKREMMADWIAVGLLEPPADVDES
jgi:hypothetical protein